MNNNISIRLFCEVSLRIGKTISLENEKTHYLKNVMRCRINDKIFVFDNNTGEYIAEIVSIKKRVCVVQVLEKTRSTNVPAAYNAQRISFSKEVTLFNPGFTKKSV